MFKHIFQKDTIFQKSSIFTYVLIIWSKIHLDFLRSSENPQMLDEIVQKKSPGLEFGWTLNSCKFDWSSTALLKIDFESRGYSRRVSNFYSTLVKYKKLTLILLFTGIFFWIEKSLQNCLLTQLDTTWTSFWLLLNPRSL